MLSARSLWFSGEEHSEVRSSIENKIEMEKKKKKLSFQEMSFLVRVR